MVPTCYYSSATTTEWIFKTRLKEVKTYSFNITVDSGRILVLRILLHLILAKTNGTTRMRTNGLDFEEA